MRQFFTLLLSLMCLLGMAQERSSEKHMISKLAVKWSPLHLINQYPTFQIAVEQRITDKISFQYDFGTVLSTNDFNNENKNKRGFKAKFEIRHYAASTRFWRFYYGPEFYYNRVNYDKAETFRVNAGDDETEVYFRHMKYGMQYREPGITLKAGAVFSVYRFCIDFNVGISGRFINYKSVNEPKPPTYQSTNDDDDSHFGPFNYFRALEQDRTVVYPAVGVRIGYIIR
jgi:hypothetical protein